MTMKWMDGVDHYGGDNSIACQGSFISLAPLHASGDMGIPSRTGTHYAYSTNNSDSYRRALGGNFRVVGQAIAVWPDGLGSRSQVPISFRDADNNVQIAVSWDSTGALQIMRGNDDITPFHTNSEPDVISGTYQHIEARIDCDASNGALEVRVNGITRLNLTGINTRPNTTASGGAGRVAQTAGRQIGFGNPAYAFDDMYAWVVDGSMGETITDFVGDKKCGWIPPNGDQSLNDFTIVADQVAGANGGSVNGNAGVTLQAPAAPRNGDLWIAVLHSSDQNAHSLPDWNQIFQDNGNSTTSRLSVWWFRYEGTTPNLVATKTNGQCMLGKIKPLRNVKRFGDPIDTVGTKDQDYSSTINHPSITPSQSGCCLLLVDGTDWDVNGRTAPSGYTQGYEYSDGFGGSNRGSIGFAYELDASSGATGAQTQGVSGNANWIGLQIAIAPATDLPAYMTINEAGPDDDTTRLDGNGVGDADFTLADLPSIAGTVVAIQVYSRAKKTDAGTCDLKNGVVSNGTEGLSDAHPLATSYAYYNDVFALNPDTGSPFEPAEVNDALLRLKRTA